MGSKRWSYDETKGLLHFYSLRQREFEQTRRKRHAFQNIVEDLIYAGICSNVTAVQCETKIQTLLRAYKSAKDNCAATGASPCIPPFYEEMEELFGKKPIHSASQSLNIGMQFLNSNPPVSSLTAAAAADVPSTSSNAASVQISSEANGHKKRKLSKSEYLKLKLELRAEEMKNAQARFEQQQTEKMERFNTKKLLIQQLLNKIK